MVSLLWPLPRENSASFPAPTISNCFQKERGLWLSAHFHCLAPLQNLETSNSGCFSSLLMHLNKIFIIYLSKYCLALNYFINSRSLIANVVLSLDYHSCGNSGWKEWRWCGDIIVQKVWLARLGSWLGLRDRDLGSDVWPNTEPSRSLWIMGSWHRSLSTYLAFLLGNISEIQSDAIWNWPRAGTLSGHNYLKKQHYNIMI